MASLASLRRLLCLCTTAWLMGGRVQPAAAAGAHTGLKRPADEAYSHSSALLLKVHAPTEAMLERWCHLEEEAAQSSFKMDVYIQYYVSRENEQNHSAWCGDGRLRVFVLRERDLRKLYGKETGGILHANRHHLGSVHEIAFHSLQRKRLDYKHLWVMEQDVAWQGNIFDAFSTYATWQDDYLCQSPHEDRLETAGNRLQKKLFVEHSGWGDAFPVHQKCLIYLARYSRRMLGALSDNFLSQGHWAQGEWFASTVCAFHSRMTEYGLGKKGFLPSRDVEESACSMRDFMSEKYLFDRHCWTHKPRAVCPQQDSFKYDIDKPFKFFHPVKW